MEVGIGRSIFSLNYSTFGCLCTDGSIQSIWKYAYDHDITVEDNVTANLQLRRQGDLYLMEVFGNKDAITSAMLQSINRCRLHMQVTTLANILTGSGNKFTGHALQCRKDENIPHYFQWAVQPRPNNRIRGIWRKGFKGCVPYLSLYTATALPLRDLAREL